MLKIKNLEKHFSGIKALNNCSLVVEKGKINALIGPNGSGKTTMFNIISGLIKPNRGSIIFSTEDGDRKIIGMPVDEISRLGISRLFQQSRLFKHLSVYDNLLIALEKDDQKFWKNIFCFNKFKKNRQKEIINNILEDFEILEIAQYKAGELSFGQKRLVELARTILSQNIFLILDEPVAGVNPKIRKTIEDILLNLRKKGSTILLIEHDMNFTLRISDKVIVMDAGKIIATGTPEQIKNNPKVLNAYLG